MAREEDRAKIKIGPARFDTPKAIRDRIAETIQETPATALVGGVTIDQVQDIVDQYQPVTGGVGQVIGIPPGTPFVYVPANLLQFPVPLHTLFNVTNATGMAIDTGNTFGLGAGSIVIRRSGGSTGSTFLSIINPATSGYSVVQPPSFSFIQMFSTGGAFFLVSGTTNMGTTLYVTYDGTSWSGISVPAPTDGGLTWRIAGFGPDSTGNNVIAVWGVSASGNTITRTYDTSLNQLTSVTETLASPGRWSFSGFGTTGQPVNNYRIVNGTMVIGNPRDSGVFIRAATGSSSPWWYNPASPNNFGAISTHAWFYSSSSGNLHRVRVSDGFSEAFPGVLSGFVPLAQSMVAVNANQIAYSRTDLVGNIRSYYYTVYDISTGFPGSITDTVLYQWDTSLVSANTRLSNVVILPNGSKAVYAGIDVSGGTAGDDVYLFNVT